MKSLCYNHDLCGYFTLHYEGGHKRMKDKNCPNCNSELKEGTEAFCNKCGFKLTADHEGSTEGASDMNESVSSSENRIIDNPISDNQLANAEGAKDAKQKKKGGIIAGAAVAVVLVAAVIIFFATGDLRTYNKAVKMFEGKKYVEASQIFNELEDYKDSKEKYHSCFYEIGKAEFENKNYNDAILNFNLAQDYSDSSKLIEESYYLIAQEFFAKEQYQDV